MCIPRSVLISGASIAGPALAYWLARRGFDVTVVERAGALRSGGYPVDLRGPAIDVVARMGLLPQLRAAHVDSRRMTFVGADGAPIGVITPEDMTGGVSGHDVEVPRGSLTTLLHELTRNDAAIRYRFGESIAALDDTGDGVEIRFATGTRGRFDVVVGADGIHSSTRAQVFGDEAQFDRYLGSRFNVFSLPNTDGLSHEAFVHSEPGRTAALYAIGDSDTLFAFLSFADERRFPAQLDAEEQLRRTTDAFAGGGWKVPQLLEAMRRSDDLYFDTVAQVHVPRWSSGRVVLVGDAAHAPSFLSGQGTSLAMIGAYVLAGELATHADPTDAFAAYERLTRPFVEANQARAASGGSRLLPRTPAELEARNQALFAMQRSGKPDARGEESRRVHTSLQLPVYEVLR